MLHLVERWKSRRKPSKVPLATWTAVDDADGSPVELRLMDSGRRASRPLQLELRFLIGEPPPAWTCVSYVASVDEAEYVLDMFYDGIFGELKRAP